MNGAGHLHNLNSKVEVVGVESPCVGDSVVKDIGRLRRWCEGNIAIRALAYRNLLALMQIRRRECRTNGSEWWFGFRDGQYGASRVTNPDLTRNASSRCGRSEVHCGTSRPSPFSSASTDGRFWRCRGTAFEDDEVVTAGSVDLEIRQILAGCIDAEGSLDGRRLLGLQNCTD